VIDKNVTEESVRRIIRISEESSYLKVSKESYSEFPKIKTSRSLDPSQRSHPEEHLSLVDTDQSWLYQRRHAQLE